MIKAVADYVRNIQDTTDLDAIAKDVFQHSQVKYEENIICLFVLNNCALYLCCTIAFSKNRVLNQVI